MIFQELGRFEGRRFVFTEPLVFMTEVIESVKISEAQIESEINEARHHAAMISVNGDWKSTPP